MFLLAPLFLQSACALGRKGPSFSFAPLGRVFGRGAVAAMRGKENTWGARNTSEHLVARVELNLILDMIPQPDQMLDFAHLPDGDDSISFK